MTEVIESEAAIALQAAIRKDADDLASRTIGNNNGASASAVRHQGTKLRAELTSAEAVAAFVVKHRTQLKQRKEMTLFLQAISGKAEVYDTFFRSYPFHVATVMETLCAFASSSTSGSKFSAKQAASKAKKAANPKLSNKKAAQVAHHTSSSSAWADHPMELEFVVRAEHAKVHRSAYTANMEQSKPPEGLEVTVLSVKEMMDSLRSRDILTLAERRVQLGSTVEELCSIFKQVSNWCDNQIDVEGAPMTEAEFLQQYGPRLTGVLTHLMSKLRSVLNPLKAPATSAAVRIDASKASAEAPYIFDIVRYANNVFITKKVPLTTKVSLVLAFLGPIIADDEELVGMSKAMSEAHRASTMSLVNQMEVVAKVKSCGATVESLDGLLDEICTEDGTLTLSTPDVLSTLAVATAALSEAGDQDGVQLLKERVALILRFAVNNDVTKLPRRAKAFLDAMVRESKKRPRSTEDAPAATAAATEAEGEVPASEEPAAANADDLKAD